MERSEIAGVDAAALRVPTSACTERDVLPDAFYPTKPHPTKAECGGPAPPTKHYGTLTVMSGGKQQYHNNRCDVPLTWNLPLYRPPLIPVMYDMTYGSARSLWATAAVYVFFAHLAVDFVFVTQESSVITLTILLFVLPAVCTTQPFGSPFATIATMVGVGLILEKQVGIYSTFLHVIGLFELGAGGTWAWRITVSILMSSLLFIVLWVLFLCGVQGLRLIRRVMSGSVSGSNFVMQAAPWLEKGASARRFRYTQWRLSSHRDRRFKHDGSVDTEHENTPPPDADPVQPTARMIAACAMSVVLSLLMLFACQITSLLILHVVQTVMGHVDCPCDMSQEVREEIDETFQAALVNATHILAGKVPGASVVASALTLFSAASMVRFLDVLYIATTSIYTALEYGSIFGIVAAGVLVVSSWALLHRATLENQRSIIRQGPPAAWRTRSVNVTNAEPFIGQMALAGVIQAVQSFIFGFLLIAVGRAAVAVYEVDHGIVIAVLKLASVSFGAMILRTLLLYLIMQPLLTDKAKMTHPRVYLVTSVLLLVLGLLAGIVSFLIRYLVTLVVVVWNLGRPDIVAFPSLFGRLDGIHTSYMSALIVDNEHNNPHLQSLCTALIADLHTARRARASHNELYNAAFFAPGCTHAQPNHCSPREEPRTTSTGLRPGARTHQPNTFQQPPCGSLAPVGPNGTKNPEPARPMPGSSAAAPLLDQHGVGRKETSVDVLSEPRAGELQLWQKEVDSFSGPTWSAVPAVRVLVEMHLRMRSGNPADPTHALQLPVAIAPVSPAQDLRRRRRAFVAARWRLAALLAANPSLRPLRKVALRAVR